MKAQFLKLAGVKDEKSFYKLFPDEKSFMAKYGKQIKKAQDGINYTFGQQNNAPGQLGYNLSGDPYKPMFGINPNSSGNLQQLSGPSIQQFASNVPTDFKVEGNDKSKGLGQIGGLMDLPGQIIKGIKNIKAEKIARKSAETWEDVSEVSLAAARSKDVDANRQIADNMTKKREMMMPVNTGEEFFPIYGVGTNPLAKNGKRVKGQIQNTYAPKTLYTNLESAQNGIGIGGDIFGQATSMMYGENAGSQLGGSLGGAVGSIFGPAGNLIGSEVGKFAGYMLDQNPQKMKTAQQNTQRNITGMSMNNWGKSLQNQNSANMRDGGSSPQVINKFGDYSMRDLLKSDQFMDTLRSGGHLKDREYIAPSERALQTFDMGGDLQVHSGGYAEPLSNNPYAKSPTVMFRGQSHDESDNKGNTGIRMTYGNSPVEVERGEPAQEFRDGGKEKSLVVFGNLPISNTILPLLGDPDAKGKKFKNYIADLSKKETVQNKIIDKSTIAIDDFTPRSSFEKLTFESHAANIKGADMNLRSLAQKKETAAALQQAVNDTADEHGVVADDLAKGNIKYAKLGATLHKAVDGYTSKYGIEPWQGNFAKGDKYGKATASEFTTEQWDNVADKLGFKGKGNKEFQEFLLQNPEAKSIIEQRHQTLYGKAPWVDPKHFGAGWAAPELKQLGYPTPGEDIIIPESPSNFNMGDPIDLQNKEVIENIPNKQKFDWMQSLNSMMPYLRPSDAEPLDARQMAGEMFALSNNQQEGVPLQTFQPQLTTPYDISHQDILNENTAASRAAQRMVGANPAAQANIAAQQYGANQRVLGEQFRENQAMKNQVYAQNRQALDNAQMRNLQAYDQQAQRQSQAKSNTKEVTQAALNSISDKFMKNQLSNRTLQTYENMYNYRFDPSMRAQNWNGVAQFDTSGAAASSKIPGMSIPAGMEPTYKTNAQGKPEISGYKLKKVSTSRNGSIVSSFKGR